MLLWMPWLPLLVVGVAAGTSKSPTFEGAKCGAKRRASGGQDGHDDDDVYEQILKLQTWTS